MSLGEIIMSPSWKPIHGLIVCGGVLLFGLVALICVTCLMRKNHNKTDLLRPFGLILIVVMAVILVVAGFTREQMAQVVGLLGTLAGYLLGSGERHAGQCAAKAPEISSDEKAGSEKH
ncbi:MAG: hypothetical protein LBU39_04200 [Desulfobulbaceae bacterium]|jgi:tryptophan-rich sensory protein|nr:hypothetical protein [Desulfobulbaceae bacterium]